MFELDGDFDFDEDFLQGVFESEKEAAKDSNENECRSGKRSFFERDSCEGTKKHKLTGNENESPHFGNVSSKDKDINMQNSTPQRMVYSRNESRQPGSQRKFPGPAGLLPDKAQTLIPSPSVNSKMFHNEDPPCSQTLISVFEGAAWMQMLKDFDLRDDNVVLNQFTVAWVKRRAAARQLLDQKVPFLAAVLRSLDCSSPDPCVVLQDKTGEIHGTLHREVWEQYGGQLSPGSILVLRHVGVLSTGMSSRRHYLNVTCNNILSIYSNASAENTKGEHNTRTTKVHEVPHSELLKSVSDWQTRLSEQERRAAPDNGVCRTVNSMFSTVGSPMNSPGHIGMLRQSVARDALPRLSYPNGWQRMHSGKSNTMEERMVSQTNSGTSPCVAYGKDKLMIKDRLNNNIHVGNTNISCQSNESSLKDQLRLNNSTPLSKQIAGNVVHSFDNKSGLHRSNSSDSPHKISAERISGNNGKLCPQHHTPVTRSMPHTSHQHDGRLTGNENFRFQPQSTSSTPSRTDSSNKLTPKFKGGFTPKMSCFSNSVPKASTSLDVSTSDKLCLDKVKTNKVNSRTTVQDSTTFFKSVSDESSVLDVLEGLDASTLFDEF